MSGDHMYIEVQRCPRSGASQIALVFEDDGEEVSFAMDLANAEAFARRILEMVAEEGHKSGILN